MKPLDETRRVEFELVRHFLARLFDSEMFSMRGGWIRVAIGALSMALPAGMLLMDPPYYHQAIDPTPETLRGIAIADQLSILTLVFAVTGIVALLAWQSLFPSRRDYLALAGLPVTSRQVFTARFTSTAIMAGVLASAMTLLPSFMTPHHFTAHAASVVPFLVNVLARAASAGLGCVFLFFSIVALQGVLVNALPARLLVRVSTYVQGALMSLFIFGGLYAWAIVNWGHDMVERLPEFGKWAPPIWFAGLYEVVVGEHAPFFTAMAWRALAAVGSAVLLALLMYAAAYRRYRKLLLESPDAVVERSKRSGGLVRLLAFSDKGNEPRIEAVLEFMAHTLSRSRMHRLVLLAYLGAAVGVMCNSALLVGFATRWAGGWPATVRFLCLYWPLGVSFTVLAGVRHAFRLPTDLPANWLFRITENQGRREWMSAVERFVIGCVIVPIQLLTLPIAAWVLGWTIAVRMTVLELLVSLTAFELLFYSWQQLPFACSYVPGKKTLVMVLGSWIGVLGVLVPLLARNIAAMSQLPELFLIFAFVYGAVWIWARNYRREGWGEARLIYEDLPDAPPNLGISEMSHRWIAEQR
ncbi:MAG: hypothetical protein JO323_19480 [Acidobacteriia bacterium]|nr:hypothetical protein [Terriglobia bacterium]